MDHSRMISIFLEPSIVVTETRPYSTSLLDPSLLDRQEFTSLRIEK